MLEDRKPTCGESPCIATAMRKASRRLSSSMTMRLRGLVCERRNMRLLSELERRSKKPPTIRYWLRVLPFLAREEQRAEQGFDVSQCQ